MCNTTDANTNTIKVRSIRALFQVPGRPKPTQPLSYARSLLQPLFNALLNPATQHTAFSYAPESLRRTWARTTIRKVVAQFADLAAQLADAQATDKSVTSGFQSSRSLVADSDKVIAQLSLDVEEVGRQIRTQFQILDLDSIDSYRRLLDILGKH